VYTPKRVISLVVVAVALVVSALAVHPATAAGRDARHTLPDGRFYVAHHPGRSVTAAVVVLHSLGHDWREGPARGWSALADREGFLAVYPDGGGSPDGRGSWNAGLCCGAATDPIRSPLGEPRKVDTGRDDVGFLAAVFADVRARYRPRATYLVGWSNGGMMAERLVAARPQLAGRMAVWGSAPEMPVPGFWTGRAWLGHGAGDTTVPWTGGVVMLDDRQVVIRPGQATARYLVGAHLTARVYTGVGHSPPAWWPAAAWAWLRAG
jgi:poly(3-hydroxybutyrate) depolymerase